MRLLAWVNELLSALELNHLNDSRRLAVMVVYMRRY